MAKPLGVAGHIFSKIRQMPPTNRVFVFWDHSNLFIGAKDVAKLKEGDDAYYQVRLSFDRIMQLAQAGRVIDSAMAVGSVPPGLRAVWNRLEKARVKVELFERGARSGKEEAVDQALQVQMLRKAIDHNGNPGIVVMLTGDGAGFFDGVGFHADLERMHKKGWRIEVISWDHSCNKRMASWAKGVGVYIPLEDYYDQVTYLEESANSIRRAKPLDLSRRPTVKPV